MVYFPDNSGDDEPFVATSPEELRDYMRAQASRNQQLSIDVRHQIEAFMEALDEDQLDTLRFMLHEATHHGASFTLWFEGYLTSMLKQRFGICPACHTNHEAELHKMSGQDASFPEAVALKEAVENRTPLADLQRDDEPTEVEGQMELDFSAPVLPPTTREEYDARKDEGVDTPHLGPMVRSDAMLAYRLEPYDDMYFYCRDCGLTYVSLEDRMLKRPDECHGCFLKASQG